MPVLHQVRKGDPITHEMFNAVIDFINGIGEPAIPQPVTACKLKDPYPGVDTEYEVYLGEWDNDDNEWLFNDADKMRSPDKVVKAIDTLGGGGADIAFYVPRRNADNRQIWELVSSGGTVGGCLNEDHPGQGTEFDIKIGTWDSAGHGWGYGDIVKAIDWRYDVPYPERGATGLFEARPSDDYGTIWEVVSLDCSSPCDEPSSGSVSCCPPGVGTSTGT